MLLTHGRLVIESMDSYGNNPTTMILVFATRRSFARKRKRIRGFGHVAAAVAIT